MEPAIPNSDSNPNHHRPYRRVRHHSPYQFHDFAFGEQTSYGTVCFTDQGTEQCLSDGWHD
ncbi:hypothetical protein [Moraxella bovoculi]|uniref:hypothetical protein n=1 Tax=Moraxella bovoculi TaxID=386891 RepID=UPI0018B0CF4A|nr:hypothetical protein [Moraxella bovoculi]